MGDEQDVDARLGDPGQEERHESSRHQQPEATPSQLVSGRKISTPREAKERECILTEEVYPETQERNGGEQERHEERSQRQTEAGPRDGPVEKRPAPDRSIEQRAQDGDEDYPGGLYNQPDDAGFN